MENKTAIIIGAGPAGLTAAYELAAKTKIKPIVFEATNDIGGISKTANYKGNRIDIGGHRFFTKSKRVNDFWDEVMERAYPLEDISDRTDERHKDDSGQELSREEALKRILTRRRVSRIYYQKHFFDYPISLSLKTFKDLGLFKTIKIVFGFIYIRIFPKKDETNLENFYINRFGLELYKTFFKSYTEKLWGIPPSEISSEWGAQRVKGISLTKVIVESVKKALGIKNGKNVETSLIEKFKYPALGPGQLWENVAEKIKDMGGEVHKNTEVVQINTENDLVKSVVTKNTKGQRTTHTADFFFSTMPVKDLILSIKPEPGQEIKDIAGGLPYRDFITVGLLYKKLDIINETKIDTLNKLIPDNWLYIHEPDVLMCRIQVFNNWSPFMVADKNNSWIGLEYVCSEQDSFWNKNDDEIVKQAIKEISHTGIASENNVLDSVVIRMKKAYPTYSGTYKDFIQIKDYLDSYSNLFPIGRNGMHRYNNMDHSMLTAMVAVDNIIENIEGKDNIWKVNTEEEYHEETKGEGN